MKRTVLPGSTAAADIRYAPLAADLLTSGEETLARDFISSATVSATSGNLRLSYFTARKSETTTQVRVPCGTTAAAATPTLVRLALYAIDASTGDGTLVASTTNDTTLFAAASTAYTKSWASSYAKVASTRYAFGVLVVSGAATPTFNGSTTIVSSEAAVAPRTMGNIASQTDLPSSFTGASVAVSGARVYAAILP